MPGSQGTCTAVVGAPRPAHGDCGGEGPCQGVCDGVDRAACVYPPEGTVCAPAGCSNGLETGTAHCDGAGACVVSSERPCGDYVCGATACLERCSTSAECAGGRICEAGTGRCLPAMVPAECEAPSCPECSGGCAIGGRGPAAWLVLLGLLALRPRSRPRRRGTSAAAAE